MKIQIPIRIEAQVDKIRNIIDVRITDNSKLFYLCSDKEQDLEIRAFQDNADEGMNTYAGFINLDLDVEVDDEGNITTCKTSNGKELDNNIYLEDKIYDQISKQTKQILVEKYTEKELAALKAVSKSAAKSFEAIPLFTRLNELKAISIETNSEIDIITKMLQILIEA